MPSIPVDNLHRQELIKKGFINSEIVSMNMNDFPFTELAGGMEEIEREPKTLTITKMVSGILSELRGQELEVSTRFLMGEAFETWNTLEMGIGSKLLYNAISKAAGCGLEDVVNMIKEEGDTGLAIYRIFREMGGKQTQIFQSEGLTVIEVFTRLKEVAEVSGKGAISKKMRHLQYLFSKTTPLEAKFLSRLIIHELRIGVGEGVLRDAISQAFDISKEDIETAIMVTNDVGLVAKTASVEGENGIQKLTINLFRPVKMMLAQLSGTSEDVISSFREVACEWKYDGVRLQAHIKDNRIKLYSRRLEDVTDSLKDVRKMIEVSFKGSSAILEGEIIALDDNGRVKPFQEVLRRVRRKYDIEESIKKVPLIFYLFDCLYLDGEGILDKTYLERRESLRSCIKEDRQGVYLAKQELVTTGSRMMEIYREAISAGHEGVMLKNPESPYTPGKRGKNWLKMKEHAKSLDLVVIGAEWGVGRRSGVYGSFTLACRRAEDGTLAVVSKVGTGMSDAKLKELAETLTPLVIKETGREVVFRPAVVFEIGYDEIQKSLNYPSGYALRFPRFIDVRNDKGVDDIETLEGLEVLYSGSFCDKS